MRLISQVCFGKERDDVQFSAEAHPLPPYLPVND